MASSDSSDASDNDRDPEDVDLWETPDPTPLAQASLRRLFSDLVHAYKTLRIDLAPPPISLDDVRFQLIDLDNDLRRLDGIYIPQMRDVVAEAISELESYIRYLLRPPSAQATRATVLTDSRWRFFKRLEEVIVNLHREVGRHLAQDPWLPDGQMPMSPDLLVEFFSYFDREYPELRRELAPPANHLKRIRSRLFRLDDVLRSCSGPRALDMRVTVRSAARNGEHYERLQRAEENSLSDAPSQARRISPRTITEVRKRFLKELDQLVEALSRETSERRGE